MATLERGKLHHLIKYHMHGIHTVLLLHEEVSTLQTLQVKNFSLKEFPKYALETCRYGDPRKGQTKS